MEKTAGDVTWAAIRSATQWSPTQAQWVIAELERSALSIKSFGERHKVGSHRIYYWRARLDAPGWQKRAPAGLVEVRMPQPAQGIALSMPTPSLIEIELLSGRRLSVSESIELGKLAELVQLLERS
jgi:hypothetical protein